MGPCGSIKTAAEGRLTDSWQDDAAPGRFPTSDCAHDFWGTEGPPNAGGRAALTTGGARVSRARTHAAAAGESTGHPGRRWMATVLPGGAGGTASSRTCSSR